MNNAKMTKKFFFDLMESNIEEIEKEVKEMKEMNEKRGYTHDVQYKHCTLHARALQISMMIFEARNIDYWKYNELDKRINSIIDETYLLNL